MQHANVGGTFTSPDGLKLFVNVTIDDPHELAEYVVPDILGMFSDYVEEVTIPEDDDPVVQLRQNLDAVVGC